MSTRDPKQPDPAPHDEPEHEVTLVDGLAARGESLYPDLDGLAEWGVSKPIDLE